MRFLINKSCIQKIVAESYKEFPKEACGVLLLKIERNKKIISILPVENSSKLFLSFNIKENQIKKIESKIIDTNYSIIGYFHSHLLGNARPSKIDCLGKKDNGELSLIYSLNYNSLKLYEWNNDKYIRRNLKSY